MESGGCGFLFERLNFSEEGWFLQNQTCPFYRWDILTRTAEYQLVAERELDENMALSKHNSFCEKIYLLYNGKSFGEGGIKYTLKIADLAA